MTYRSDTDALEARLDVLEKDLADRTRERDEVAHMLVEARATDAARRWLDERPRRRRRRMIFAGITAAMMAFGGIVTFFALRHDPQRDHDEQVLRQMTQFKDDMCKCTESKCAQAVSDRMTAWGQEMAKTEPYDKGNHPSEELIKRMTVIVEDLSKCMTTAMGTP